MSAVAGLRRSALPWLVYPGAMTLCLGLFALLRTLGLPIFLCGALPVVLGAGLVSAFEALLPERRGWTADRRELGTDLLYMLAVQIILPRLLGLLATLLLARLLAAEGAGPWLEGARGLWVHRAPIALQVILMILLADLLRYGLHVAAHRVSWLWRLHAVHHSPNKLYWLNVGRFHPLEKAMQFLFDALPFVVLGVADEVLALYFVFYAVNGFFQHCNVHLRFGWLNYLISSAELHRWHHSRVSAESNANYGNNIILWDLLFGTRFLPRQREVASLGLMHEAYPQGFSAQMRAPFVGGADKQRVPVGSWTDLLRNAGLHLWMVLIGRREYDRAVRAARHPRQEQEEVLRRILREHQCTRLGRELGLGHIDSIEEFQRRVPRHDYEMLRPYIEQQERSAEPWLNPEAPVLYNLTSGTTGQPRLLPVLARTLRDLRKGQRLFSYVQYRAHPAGFQGKILGITGAAEEGRTEGGTPIGSASGHLYHHMPWLMRGKYVLPHEVFDIQDPDIKVSTIVRLALQHADLSYMATANPSTLLRLLETFENEREALLEDLCTGRYRFRDQVPAAVAAAVQRCCRPHPARARALELPSSPSGREGAWGFGELWPCLQTVVTWTGGSCGVALSSVRHRLPPGTRIFELGYLASELRGTVTIDQGTQAGLPTLQENFFEFVLQSGAQSGSPSAGEEEVLTLDQLQPGGVYRVLVTTAAGLLRYDMNDLVEVCGRFEQTPTLRFLQKGAGVTSITGEKLYEAQLLDALAAVESSLGVRTRFVQVLADASAAVYRAYVQLDPGSTVDAAALAEGWDREIQARNLEYCAKRASRRLHTLRLRLLREGSLEAVKRHAVSAGQRESQFKTVALRPAEHSSFDFDAWCEEES